MKKLLLVALYGALMQGSIVQGAIVAPPEAPPQLSIELQSDKPHYDPCEPIWLTYSVRNTSKESSYTLGADCLGLLTIKMPDGKIIKSDPWIKANIEWKNAQHVRPPDELISVPTQGFFGRTFNLLEAFPREEVFPGQRGFSQNQPALFTPDFALPGKYEIVCRYRGPTATGYSHLFDLRALRGQASEIASRPLIIEVDSIGPAQLKKWKKALQIGQDAEAQIKTLDIIRKIQVRALLKQVEALLNSGAPLSVRRAAAETLRAMPEVRFVNTYLNNLTEEDIGIHGSMMDSIVALQGQLSPAQTKKTVATVIKLADYKTYPDTYMLALHILSVFKAPESQPVLQELAQSAPNIEARRRAQVALEAISGQPSALSSQL